MSFFKKLAGKGLRAISKISKVAKFIPGPVGAVGRVGSVLGGLGGRVGGGVLKAAGAGGAAGALVKYASRPGVGVGAMAGRALGVAGVAATGVAVYDAAGNYLGQRRRGRRINPLNHKALKRAMSRIEKSKHLVKRLNSITIRKEKC